MFAIALRTLCAAVVLVGVAGERPIVQARTDTPGQAVFAPDCAGPAATDAPAISHDPIAYRDEGFYRIYRVTAYCDRGTTAAGVPAGVGQCAAPASIPFGTRIYIPALDRTFIVTDRTARRFRHNTVDLFIPNRADCKQFGCQYLECELVIPAERVRYGSSRLASAIRAGVR